MERQTISAPRFEVRRRRRQPMAMRRRRFLLIAAVLSVAFHLGAALLVVLLPRILPGEPRQEEQGTVELLMVEQKGAEPSEAGQPQNATPAPVPPAPIPAPPAPPEPVHAEPMPAEPAASEPVPSEKAGAAKAEDQKDATAAPSPEAASESPASEHTDERAPAPAPAEQAPPEAATRPARTQVEAQPSPPQSREAPVFDLSGTESESNAIVLGGRVLPAMKDDRFRNRPPLYPVEAGIRGQHGSVVVVIHVSENGLATGADVLESSGFDSLDQAAVTAVRKWHFHPAMKAGRAVPFDMPFRFIFEAF
jgi:periplasmic protein TonB